MKRLKKEKNWNKGRSQAEISMFLDSIESIEEDKINVQKDWEEENIESDIERDWGRIPWDRNKIIKRDKNVLSCNYR